MQRSCNGGSLKSGLEVDMKFERKRRHPWTVWLALLALVIGLAGCGGQDTPQTGTAWDSGRFDQATWQ